MNQPLEEIRVLDLTRVISGPHCTMTLADMGAEVIKIEKPGEGDMTRSHEPKYEGVSTYFMAYNRNKKSITLNFRKPEAKGIFLELVKQADVVVENFRAGTMEAMGLGYEVLHAVNPKIILTRISGYGQQGPYADRTCFDGAAQSMSGLVDVTGDIGGTPYMTGTYIVDLSTSLYATVGTLGALYEAEKTGQGRIVDVALLDVAFSFLHTAVPDGALLHQSFTRNGNNDRYMWPANIYPAQNGRWVYIHAGMERCYKDLMLEIGHPELLDDPEHGATRQARSSEAGKAYNDQLITEWTRQHTAEQIVALLAPKGIPCAKVNTALEAMNDPQLLYRGMIQHYARDGREGVCAGSPLHYSGSEFAVRMAPPQLGEHTREVFASLGYSDAELAALQEKGVI